MSDRYDYLIVGGGMAADAAARGIRELDAEGSIGIVSADIDAPYTRPALSKKLWTDPEFTWDQVPLNTAEDTGASVYLEAPVVSIDRFARTVTTRAGITIGYGRLLLATGAMPKRLTAADNSRIIHFRSARDYQTLREFAAASTPVLVVGGGFIGAELAAGLVQNDLRVTLVHGEEMLGGDVYPREIAAEYQERFEDAGIDIRGGRRVERVSVGGEGFIVTLDDGSEIPAEIIVAGLGVTPVTELAEELGLLVDDGIVVDAHLKTSDSSIWAAGDVASYPDPILGRTRVEHVDQAEQMGRAAGRSMAGSDQPYTHTPSFYSDVFDIDWEAVGTLDASLDTIVDRIDDRRVVVYYLDGSTPVGVLLWRVSDGTDAAREVLAHPPADPEDLRGRIR